jgi:hypothetical protein
MMSMTEILRPGSIQLGDRGVPGVMAARPSGTTGCRSQERALSGRLTYRGRGRLDVSVVYGPRGCDLQTFCLIPGRSVGTALLRRRGGPSTLIDEDTP